MQELYKRVSNLCKKNVLPGDLSSLFNNYAAAIAILLIGGAIILTNSAIAVVLLMEL